MIPWSSHAAQDDRFGSHALPKTSNWKRQKNIWRKCMEIPNVDWDERNNNWKNWARRWKKRMQWKSIYAKNWRYSIPLPKITVPTPTWQHVLTPWQRSFFTISPAHSSFSTLPEQRVLWFSFDHSSNNRSIWVNCATASGWFLWQHPLWSFRFGRTHFFETWSGAQWNHYKRHIRSATVSRDAELQEA